METRCIEEALRRYLAQMLIFVRDRFDHSPLIQMPLFRPQSKQKKAFPIIVIHRRFGGCSALRDRRIFHMEALRAMHQEMHGFDDGIRGISFVWIKVKPKVFCQVAAAHEEASSGQFLFRFGELSKVL